MNPKLRAVQPDFIEYEGNPYIMLKDPLSLTEEVLLVPQQMGLLLGLCDGTRDEAELKAAFELHSGVSLPEDIIAQVISRLDEALLLQNDRFERACQSSLSKFRDSPYRPPALIHGGYPADPDNLRDMLKGYLDGVPESESPAGIKGIISPHIDYQRGASVYAQVWQKAARAIEDVDLVVIFGTNHQGSGSLFTLTRQNYATPFGVLPTATGIVDQLADMVGPGFTFEDELHHRNEHSIELALVWLHYFLGERKCELVPILCGSFERFISGDDDPLINEEVSGVVNCLRDVADSRNVLFVAAGDLAHMGPAFGDNDPVKESDRAQISIADESLIEAMCNTDAEEFFMQIREEEDARRICGLSPIYLTLRLLGESKGQACGYEQCPADEMNASMVSICGVVMMG